MARRSASPPVPEWRQGPRLATAPAPGDSFAGADDHDSDYDRAAFYVTASDEHGHSEVIHLRLNRRVTAELRRVLSEGKLIGTPLDSLGAIIRDAVVHEMHRLAEIIDDLDLAVAARNERHLARIDMHQRDAERNALIVRNARKAIDDALQAADYPMLVAALADYDKIELRQPYATQLDAILARARPFAT